MQVKDIMTSSPKSCTKDTSLTDVARMMVDCNCGAIPVTEGKTNPKLVGIVTDRDIVCRTLADGKDPYQMAAGDCMSVDLVTVRPDADVDECARQMQDHQIRRILVADNGKLCGVVAQADLAKKASPEKTAQTVKKVSQPVGAV